MKNERNPLQITKISFEDFKKLDLYGYEYRRHYYRNGTKVEQEECGEYVTDSNGDKHWVQFNDTYSKVEWDKVSLTAKVADEIEFSKENKWENPICIAIHKNFSINDIPKKDRYFFESAKKDSQESLMRFYNSYLDKWLTRQGNQTYLIRCDVKHLYSKRNHFYTIDDYFDIPKSETEAVYLIYWN